MARYNYREKGLEQKRAKIAGYIDIIFARQDIRSDKRQDETPGHIQEKWDTSGSCGIIRGSLGVIGAINRHHRAMLSHFEANLYETERRGTKNHPCWEPI